MHACHKVLMEVNNNSALIVGDPHGILGQKLRPLLSKLLNIIILLINCLLNKIELNCIAKLVTSCPKDKTLYFVLKFLDKRTLRPYAPLAIISSWCQWQDSNPQT
jgi:hypothetical protein